MSFLMLTCARGIAAQRNTRIGVGFGLLDVYAGDGLCAWVHRCRVIAPVERIQICVCESDCLWLGARLYDLTGLRPSTMLVFALAILSRRIFSSLARGCAPLLPFSREHSSAGPRRYWPRQGDRLWRRTWHHRGYLCCAPGCAAAHHRRSPGRYIPCCK